MSLPIVLKRCADLGYKVFTDEMDLNIVAIRSADQTPNVFNDLLTISYRKSGQWYTRSWACTTDPGLYWLQNPGRVAGTAALCPGQHRSSHTLGKHRGRYTALTQCGPVRVFRDPDGSDQHALGGEGSTIDECLFGINIHRANATRTSTQVDRWSAGCIVCADPTDFAAVILLAKAQIKAHPTWTKYSLTLLEEW